MKITVKWCLLLVPLVFILLSCKQDPYIYITFDVTPNPIIKGNSATLRWNVTGADMVTIDNGIGEVPPFGNKEVSPGEAQKYTLTATNPGRKVEEIVAVDVIADAASAAQKPTTTENTSAVKAIATPAPAPADASNSIKFVYQSFDGIPQIYSMKERSQDRINLTKTTKNSQQPAWSPDGKRVAFISNRDGTDQVYTVDIDGNNITKLTSIVGDVRQPIWSPDGNKIAFYSGFNWPEPNFATYKYVSNSIYVMNSDGTNLVNITASQSDLADSVHIQHMWSPDSKKLVFVSMKVGLKRQGDIIDYTSEKYPDIFVIYADGSGLVSLTRIERIIDKGADPNFAAIIAKERIEDTLHESYASPSWSPDGKRIAFLANIEGGYAGNDYWQIYTMTDNGKDLKRLGSVEIIGWFLPSRNYPTAWLAGNSRQTGAWASFLHWSPDGRYIAVSALAIQQDSTRDYRAAVVDAKDGTILFSQKAGRSTLCWSPDSKKIAFVPENRLPDLSMNSARNIQIVNYDGSDPKTIFDALVDGYLNWRP